MKWLSVSFHVFLLYFFATPGMTNAAEKNVAPNMTVPGNIVQIVVSLIVVIGLLILLSVAFKKFGLDRMNSNFPVKVINAINLGSNQRIMTIEVGDEWLVLGITAQHITTLTSMPRQEVSDKSHFGSTEKLNLPDWMQSAVKKYSYRKS
ncbi:MAG: flagellar biosynthesis protein FliO [Solimicrobium sp.]|jgi:flagellar protein FliO/FliZ|nr:flagellar biosynthesis protein FliO [Solimicrobium sp.]